MAVRTSRALFNVPTFSKGNMSEPLELYEQGKIPKPTPRTQRMYKVGFGPNLNGIISEDSLDRVTYLPGAIEYIGDRTIWTIPTNE